ncbi:MAG: T9SS type A sorting domain-containing protein [Bacteroidetes bacterium]|nr:T9SS type A sorting domain-containing protein [Bacteroidota bacterium]
MSFQPQFENPSFNDISDRIGWTHLTGTFIADGGEKYLILGNFRDSLTVTVTLTGWGTIPQYVISSYLYIDDILVTPTDSLTSLGELNFNKEFSLSTLNENEFEIESVNFPINNYVIINGLGQIIEERLNIESYSLQLNLKGYSKGIYFVRLRIRNDKIYNLKILKP